MTKSELKSLVEVAQQFANNSKNKQLDKAKQIKVSIDKYGLTPEAVLDMDILNQLNASGKRLPVRQRTFYTTYANTAPSSNTAYYVNGQRIYW